ncbi:MAG: NADH dehydrogenase 1 alpha subcomplex assembly factor 3 [Linnemannia elongata]|nr:MAG: NADH dehydrogenase 1 alpha subcomplex assembly factor 3 [Linnemannia elongata]
MLRTPFRTTTRTLARLSTTHRTALTTTTSTPAAYSRPFSSNTILRSLHNNDNNDRKEHHGEAGNAAATAAGTGALRQKSVPTPGTNEDADSAISGFMNMFNERESRTVSITTCTKHGFVTTEAITLQGPVLCIGGQVFLWDIFKEGGAVDKYLKKNTAASSSPASSSTTATPQQPARSIFEIMDEDTAKEIFKVFELMNPRPEILIVGTGKAFAPLSPAVRAVVRSLGLQVDMMSTANAAATYNMLAEEGREVAAALLPLEPSTVQVIRNNRQ